jgi:hypothetical protein
VKKILAGAVGGAAALAVIFGAGPAVADNEYKGLTYAKVQERTGNRAVISSRTGSYLPTEECIVTGNRRASFLDSSGNGNAKILVDLNCNDTTALNGHPGNSVVTPAGQKALEVREKADNLSKNYARAIEAGTVPNCLSNEGAIGYCIKLCKESKNCSAELLEALGQ